MKGNRFKQDNRGASLLAVLVLMVVVSLIAVVITKITIVNIEMKEVERGTKKNFYSADELMDNLRAGARELAEQSLEKAYADVLENYLTYSASGGDVQKVFATRYMDGLQKQFAENHTDPAVGASDTMDASGNVAYRVSGYDTDTVKSCIKEAADQGCYIPAADPKYEVDYGAGTFTLKGVQIRYKDAQDYETTIKTDLVFSTPKMNFSGSGQVQEFMRYALIADRQINIGAQNVTVDGNVYAGADGIYASTGGNGTITLTKGDGTKKTIEVSQGTTVNSFIDSLKEAGVNASYDDINKRIFVSSKDTGKDNDFTLTGGNVDGANALTKLGLNVKSDATDATYKTYMQYYGDGTDAGITAKVNEAIKIYQDAQAAYKKASAENSNLSAAYGYASAYSAMKEAFKKSGLNTTQQEELTKLLQMSATDRAKSVVTSDGTIYTAETSDADGNTIFSYGEGDNKKYIKSVNTYTDTNGKSYTRTDVDGTKLIKDGKEYTATGEKDADGNATYKDADGNVVSIKVNTSY